jgi:hypothetical protein
VAISCELGQTWKGAAAATDSGAVIRLATTFLVFARTLAKKLRTGYLVFTRTLIKVVRAGGYLVFESRAFKKS